MKTVLIIEESCEIQQMYFAQLAGKIVLIPATTLLKAVGLFRNNLDAIAIAGKFWGEHYDPIPTIKAFRRSFTGPIITTSFMPELQKAMMEAGCDYQCEKVNLPAFLVQLLEL